MLYNLVYNYVMAYRVGPGYPTHVLDSVLDQHSVDKKCKKCQGRKPIRTHHCSICNKCVMQMDRNYTIYHRSLSMAGQLYRPFQSSIFYSFFNIFESNLLFSCFVNHISRFAKYLYLYRRGR